jgi:UDP-N-acetylglucosamine 2-epimerase
MKVATVLGARPQFIKASVLSPQLKCLGIHEVVLHTGQHYDYEMSKLFFDELGLAEPDYMLDVGSGSHAWQTGEMMKRLEPILVEEQPDWVLVYGDTNSTLAGALVAAKLQLRLVHVEAGLRSFNRTMPEEINRILADHAADMWFAPTLHAVHNLEREGITTNVYFVGDLMADLALATLKGLSPRSDILRRLSVESKQFVLATIHRPANTDSHEIFEQIIKGIEAVALPTILPAHPRIRRQLTEIYGSSQPSNVRVCEPLGYRDLIALQSHARVVITDSGGIQKESYVLGTPCVTLREETEWVETLEDDWNTLAGSDAHLIATQARRPKPRSARREFFGSGRAAQQIAQILKRNHEAVEDALVG